MRREDYILRLISEFVRSLHRITGLARDGQQIAALEAIDHAARQMTGDGLDRALRLSAPELIARLAFAESEAGGRDRCAFVAALLKEAGGAYSALGREDEADACFVHALELHLAALRRFGGDGWPEFTPDVDSLVAAVGLYRLPPPLYAALVAHYEQVGAFADAEDALFAWLEAAPLAAIGPGVALFERLAALDDEALRAGDLSRQEVEEALAELRGRR